jgi:hypothetical protein
MKTPVPAEYWNLNFKVMEEIITDTITFLKDFYAKPGNDVHRDYGFSPGKPVKNRGKMIYDLIEYMQDAFKELKDVGAGTDSAHGQRVASLVKYFDKFKQRLGEAYNITDKNRKMQLGKRFGEDALKHVNWLIAEVTHPEAKKGLMQLRGKIRNIISWSSGGSDNITRPYVIQLGQYWHSAEFQKTAETITNTSDRTKIERFEMLKQSLEKVTRRPWKLNLNNATEFAAAPKGGAR